MALAVGLESLNTQITSAGRATRQDIYEALQVIKAADPENFDVVKAEQIALLVGDVYNEEQIAKLITSLDSYEV